MRQLLGSLHKNGLLAFDLAERRWSWGIAQIERVGITENVVELLLEAIRRLPDETRDLLPLAACIGQRAGLSELVGVADKTEDDVRSALQPAVKEGLLVLDGAPDVYRFAHDRVQQAAYSLLSEPRRKAAHLRIGRLLGACRARRSGLPPGRSRRSRRSSRLDEARSSAHSTT